MRPSRRHPLSPAHDRPRPARLQRGRPALSHRSPGGVAAMDDSEKRRALIDAVLPDVPFDGWSHAAIDAAARHAGLATSDVAALFPGGVRDVVAGFSHWAD